MHVSTEPYLDVFITSFHQSSFSHLHEVQWTEIKKWAGLRGVLLKDVSGLGPGQTGFRTNQRPLVWRGPPSHNAILNVPPCHLTFSFAVCPCDFHLPEPRLPPCGQTEELEGSRVTTSQRQIKRAKSYASHSFLFFLSSEPWCVCDFVELDIIE